ncbi:MAG: VanZ family protein [Chloroflexota bacterium]|nr:VanZ family protein [Chloroflexota bacterium]
MRPTAREPALAAATVPAMGIFASKRERRLWLWTLVVLTAIYATLGLAPMLAEVLRERGWLPAAVACGLVLVGLTIVTQGLQVRPGGVEIAVGLGIAAAYLLLVARLMAGQEERTHLMEYGVVGVFVYEALAERARHGRRVPLPPLIAVLATGSLGLLDEGVQAVLPNRVFDPRDLLFNLLAGTTAVGACVALGWVRRRAGGRPE